MSSSCSLSALSTLFVTSTNCLGPYPRVLRCSVAADTSYLGADRCVGAVWENSLCHRKMGARCSRAAEPSNIGVPSHHQTEELGNPKKTNILALAHINACLQPLRPCLNNTQTSATHGWIPFGLQQGLQVLLCCNCFVLLQKKKNEPLPKCKIPMTLVLCRRPL